MELRSIRGVMTGGLFAVIAAGAVGCGSASGATSWVEDDRLVIQWEGAGAGLYVTDLAATAPGGPDDVVEGGKTFWAIEATSFPGGFDGPVKYGEVPEDAKDVTDENGGPKGGIPLEDGLTYKITIQGFGGDPTIREFTWGEK